MRDAANKRLFPAEKALVTITALIREGRPVLRQCNSMRDDKCLAFDSCPREGQYPRRLSGITRFPGGCQ
jgi:hypothetical protein